MFFKHKNNKKPYWEEHFSEVIFIGENGDLQTGKIDYSNLYGGSFCGGIINANIDIKNN